MAISNPQSAVSGRGGAKAAYWRGVRSGAPFLLVIVPFGALFGVVATEAGLPLLEVMAFTILVIAGAAQFTALQLMTEDSPTIIVIISALAVNLRMAMYSASLTMHLGQAPLWHRALIAYFCVDQSYACSVTEYERHPEMTLAEKTAFFAGSISPIAPMWYLATLLGAALGTAIPPEYALDFAVPITFLAIIAPALRTLPHVIAALVSATLALLFVWVPYNMGLIIAASIAMIAGAQAELWLERRK
jgi:predicted branched-subunit amino acid permease